MTRTEIEAMLAHGRSEAAKADSCAGELDAWTRVVAQHMPLDDEYRGRRGYLSNPKITSERNVWAGADRQSVQVRRIDPAAAAGRKLCEETDPPRLGTPRLRDAAPGALQATDSRRRP